MMAESRTLRTFLIWFPPVSVLVYMLFLMAPTTRGMAWATLMEAGVVETATFVLFIVAGAMGFMVARRYWNATGRRGCAVCFSLAALALIFIALEEAAYGQHYFGFKTPEAMLALNQQQELTLHNLPGVHGKTEWFRLAFGLGGLAGVALVRIAPLAAFATPSVLVSSSITIAVASFFDLVNDKMTLHPGFDQAVADVSEHVELLCAIMAVVYMRTKLNASA